MKIIHFPFTDETKTKFVQNVDIGIDFSSNRPENENALIGNAKLLEYCYYGIKTVSEKHVNNSHLVESAKNGILLEGVGTADDYVEAIKKLKDMKYDRDFAINTTIKNNNWDLIASEIYQEFISVHEKSYKNLTKLLD